MINLDKLEKSCKALAHRNLRLPIAFMELIQEVKSLRAKLEMANKALNEILLNRFLAYPIEKIAQEALKEMEEDSK